MRDAVRLSLKMLSFARHKRSHASDQPFVCEVCGKAFTVTGSFERQKRSHTSLQLNPLLLWKICSHIQPLKETSMEPNRQETAQVCTLSCFLHLKNQIQERHQNSFWNFARAHLNTSEVKKVNEWKELHMFCPLGGREGNGKEKKHLQIEFWFVLWALYLIYKRRYFLVHRWCKLVLLNFFFFLIKSCVAFVPFYTYNHACPFPGCTCYCCFVFLRLKKKSHAPS